jgi:hypothetical protein
MKIISWNEWLDGYIPYYERQRHRERFLDDPPTSVLVVYIMDRAVRHIPGQPWETWDDLNHTIHDLGYRCSPMFLERDTRQEWYWAFWSEKELTLALLRLL